jgi:hypothetical protein
MLERWQDIYAMNSSIPFPKEEIKNKDSAGISMF